MTRRPTTAQISTLERIRVGLPPEAASPPSLLRVASFETHHQGCGVYACHRTVARTDVPGHFRTELYRVFPDGRAERF